MDTNKERCKLHHNAPHIWQGPHWDEFGSLDIDKLVCTGPSPTRGCGRVIDTRPTVWNDDELHQVPA